MADNNSILQKLEGLESRFEEVSTLITDPEVIADQQRFVKLTKEYKDLSDIMDARKRYINCLESIKEAKDILANESDAEMKEMAREQLAENEAVQPQIEEEIKQERVDGIMRQQIEISLASNQDKIGQVLEVLVEDRDEDGAYIGRTEYDAPEIDNSVI